MSRTTFDKALANDLAHRYQRGEKNTLSELYSLLIPYMVRKARYAGAGEDAWDIAHDAFLCLTVRLSDTASPVLIDNMLAYATTVVYRLTLNLLYRERRPAIVDVESMQMLSSLAMSCESQSPEAIVSTRSSNQWRCAVLEEALPSLAPRHRQVIRMHHIHGMKCGEIARVLGIPADTVVNRLRYARQRLSKVLADELSAERLKELLS